MTETTIRGQRVPGSIPGGGSEENQAITGTSPSTTEQCSVEIAKVMPPQCDAGVLPRSGDRVEVWREGLGMFQGASVVTDCVSHSEGDLCIVDGFGVLFGDGPEVETVVPFGGDWRWPVGGSDAGDLKVVQEVVVHQRLRRTAGRNGTPEPEAIPEEAEQPNDKQPYSATTTCRVCGNFTPCACGPATVRICKGIPIAQGPDEACTCVLGPGLERCVVCAEWMQRCGQCDGCCGHLPGWTVTGYLCKECRDLRFVTRQRREGLADRVRAILDDAEGKAWRAVAKDQAQRAEAILADATEKAWQALAESPDLDPLTVGVCKRLRDMERGS